MKQCERVEMDALVPLPASVTSCAIVDEVGNEQVITDLMIRRACELMDGTQTWPCDDEIANAQHRPRPRRAEVISFASFKR